MSLFNKPKGQSFFSGAALVARKELLEAARDKQTVLYTIVLPICMYPVMFWIMIQGFMVVQGLREQTEVRVGVLGDERQIDGELRNSLDPRLEASDEEIDGPAINAIAVIDANATSPTGNPTDDPEAARAWALAQDELSDDERLDVVLYVPSAEAVLAAAELEPSNNEQAPTDGSAADLTRELPQGQTQIFYDGARSRSNLAQSRLEDRLMSRAQLLRRLAAEERDVDPRLLKPLSVSSHDTAPGPGKGALVLSMILPLLLVTMAVMGAFFPAVDLTAGEKERGTAETTLLVPMPRTGVLVGKVLATCTLAVIATFLNLGAIAFSAEHLLSTLARGTALEIPLPLGAMLSVLPLALLFAFFVAAILTAIAGLARSFKEGQALLGPAQMLFIMPAMIGMVPGIELDLAWALVPVVNVVLAFKALLLGKSLPLEYIVCGLSQLVYAGLAMTFAVRLLSREAVALSGETLPLKRLFALLRSDGSSS